MGDIASARRRKKGKNKEYEILWSADAGNAIHSAGYLRVFD